MGEKEITDIASDEAIILAESRVRSIVYNAKCILKASISLSVTCKYAMNRLLVVLNFVDLNV